MVFRGRISIVRLAAASCVAAIGVAGAAGSASAATRYAGSAANGPEPCSQAAPCALTNAVNNAKDNDEIVVLPGSYTLTAPLNASFRVLNIHGLLGRAGASTISADGLPHNGSGVAALGMSTGGRVADLTFTSTQQAVNVRDMIDAVGSVTVERVRILTVDTSGVVSGGASTVVSDSVISITGNAVGISLWSATGAQIWNDTIVATSGTSGTASGIAASGGAATAVIKNSIIRGNHTDLSPGGNPGTTFAVDYSSYGSSPSGGGGGIVTAGPHNQTSQPVFVNAGAGDFREAAGSPTIDAGTSGSTGSYDVAGNVRTAGPAPDIGAYEYLAPPYAATGGATGLASAAAIVAGTVNPLGLAGTGWQFSYGLTGAYGSLTASVDAGSANAPSTVSATLSGLRPYTTYHYRLLVTGPGGVTDGGDRTFTTLGIAPVGTAAPTVSGTPGLGSTLTCSPGGWSGTPAPTLTYAWLRDGALIGGATSANYNIQPADQGHTLVCAVTATNSSGHAAATSSR